MTDYLSIGLKFLKDIKIVINKNDILEWFVLKQNPQGSFHELILLPYTDNDLEVLMLDIYGEGSYLNTVERENIIEFKVWDKWLISYRKISLNINHDLSHYTEQHISTIDRLINMTRDSNLKDFLLILSEYIAVAKYSMETTNLEINKLNDAEVNREYLENAYLLL